MKKALSIIMASALAAMPLSVNAFAENKNTCGIRDALQKIITVYSDTYEVSQNNCGLQSLIGILLEKQNLVDPGEGNACTDGNCTENSCGSCTDNNEWQNITDTVLPEKEPELPQGGTGSVIQSEVSQVIELVNSYRAQNGLSAVKYDANTTCAAEIRAAEQEQLFSHTRPNGASCFTALDECAANYRGAGENIAMGQTSAEQVMNDWMNSAGHRENILNPNFTKIGVGLHIGANGRYYWAQMFTY